MQKIKDFLATKAGMQIYSFLKTYLTVFLGIALFADQAGTDIFTSAFLITAGKASLVSVLRNVYKLLTE
jgi:hypothetical protein